MAYSDYGGYAYKDGKLRKDFCDVIPFSEHSPNPEKHYPFFFSQKENKNEPVHVSLGDMKARVGLRKQSSFKIFLGKKKVDEFKALTLDSKKKVPNFKNSYEGMDYFNTDAFLEAGEVAVFKFGAFKLEMFWEETDNFYQFARLTQPDGSVWTGFSGYGIGAGLEDSGYGFSTERQKKRLDEIFPFLMAL